MINSWFMSECVSLQMIILVIDSFFFQFFFSVSCYSMTTNIANMHVDDDVPVLQAVFYKSPYLVSSFEK